MAYTNTQLTMKFGHHPAASAAPRPINLPVYDMSADRQEYNNTCRPLKKASFIGDWQAASVIINARRDLLGYSITANMETILHLAASQEASKLTEEFLENLVEMMEIKDLELQKSDSWTALMVAASNGSMKMAETLLNKNPALISIPDNDDFLPVSISARFGHLELTRYLYNFPAGTIPTYMTSSNLYRLVASCIRSEMYDITLRTLEDFPGKLDYRLYAIILNELARRPKSLNIPEQNIIWKNIDRIFVKLHMKNGTSENDQPAALKLLKKVLHICTRSAPEIELEILEGPCFEGTSGTKQKVSERPFGLIFDAVEMGNIAFLIELFQIYPQVLSVENDDGDTIFHVAIKHRQHGVYNLLYEIGQKRLLATTHRNKEGNTILHVLAKSSNEIHLQATSGASLLMQRELLWFQDVEKMLPPGLRDRKNNDGQTAYQLFFKANKDLISGGLKWIRDCMVTATLIVTVAFAVAFTVPGGYNQETGFPIFLHEPSFLVFVIADAISLFSASTSLLVFLSILTTRYGQKDFLDSLPKKLMIGLLTLFISVVAMMVTFSASFFVLYHHGLKWVPIVISILSGIPVILFAAFQLPLWLDMCRSTFDSRYLFHPKRRMLYSDSMV